MAGLPYGKEYLAICPREGVKWAENWFPLFLKRSIWRDSMGSRIMRPILYQLFVRHFSNHATGGEPWGSRERNGCGTFNGITDAALEQIARMGVTHLWLTGVLRHATQTGHEGMPADSSCVVKGVAGSPYAVTDYFDVDPDLAENIPQRREEFAALLQRCRRWGMVPVMDFIPNHVSRSYQSRVRPERQFGLHDDTSSFFARDNSFYYLEPHHANTPMVLPEGEFVPERGCGRVTGNNVASWNPGAYDWYETVKLNYGSDYRHGCHATAALPSLFAPEYALPLTWQLMNEVLAYWQDMGVGGFRCDMAHMVPLPFWRWVIARARLRDSSAFFIAEGYDDHLKLVESPVHAALLSAGFNGVYDGGAYESLRKIYEGGAWANDLDVLHRSETPLFTGGVRYVENHDEPRMAASSYWGGVGEKVVPAVMVAQYCSTCGPVLVYNGQEVGERAEGPGGYGGNNGRTSIFDYTYLPRFQHWTNGGRYDGAALSAEERALRDLTARLLTLLQHPALSKGGFYGLNWANLETPGFGRCPGDSVSGHSVYAFLRHYRKAKSTLLVVCNFNPHEAVETQVHIPRHAAEWAGKKKGTHVFISLLDSDPPIIEVDSEHLEGAGLPVSVPPGQALILEWC